MPRRRRRRFPERELLDQLAKYERLLRQNNIDFVPLHQTVEATRPSQEEDGFDSEEDQAQEETNEHSPATTIKSEKAAEPRYIFLGIHIILADLTLLGIFGKQCVVGYDTFNFP